MTTTLRSLIVSAALVGTVAGGSLAPSVTSCASMEYQLVHRFHNTSVLTPPDFGQCVVAEFHTALVVGLR